MAFIDRQAPERLAYTLKRTLDSLVVFRDGSGPWKERDIIAYFTLVRASTKALNTIESDMVKNPTATMANIKDNGGPDNVADFTAKSQAIETSTANFRQLFKQVLADTSAEFFKPSITEATEGSRKAAIWTPSNDLPGSAANTLRQSQELTDLIQALENAGA